MGWMNIGEIKTSVLTRGSEIRVFDECCSSVEEACNVFREELKRLIQEDEDEMFEGKCC